MADDTGAPGAKDKPGRFRGFRHAGVLIASQTRAAANRRGYAEARLKALWSDVVGPEIAALAGPLKLTSLRGPAGGLLTLGVAGANGPRVQMLLPVIRDRVNAALGPRAVGRIQITQAPFPSQPNPTPPAPRPEPLDMSAPDFAEPLSSIGDADLRAALETLARNVLSRTRKAATKEA